MVINIKYHSPLINFNDLIMFTNLHHKRDVDVTTMIIIFHCYKTESPVELDATVDKSTQNILKMMKCLITTNEDDEIITNIF